MKKLDVTLVWEGRRGEKRGEEGRRGEKRGEEGREEKARLESPIGNDHF